MSERRKPVSSPVQEPSGLWVTLQHKRIDQLQTDIKAGQAEADLLAERMPAILARIR